MLAVAKTAGINSFIKAPDFSSALLAAVNVCFDSFVKYFELILFYKTGVEFKLDYTKYFFILNL